MAAYNPMTQESESDERRQQVHAALRTPAARGTR